MKYFTSTYEVEGNTFYHKRSIDGELLGIVHNIGNTFLVSSVD